jgi:hypothetical protein
VELPESRCTAQNGVVFRIEDTNPLGAFLLFLALVGSSSAGT